MTSSSWPWFFNQGLHMGRCHQLLYQALMWNGTSMPLEREVIATLLTVLPSVWVSCHLHDWCACLFRTN